MWWKGFLALLYLCATAEVLDMTGTQDSELQSRNLVKRSVPSSVWPSLERCVNLDRAS